jgi:hypothetical protein
MSTKAAPDVKVSGALPGDWGVRKAQEMHRKNAVRIDAAEERAENQRQARLERRQRKTA